VTLERNAKRRLALYGSAAAVAVGLLLASQLLRKREPQLIRRLETGAALHHEATELLRQYVRIDTTNPPGYTAEAAAFLARAFACEGIPYQIVGDDPRRPIFLARLEGTRHDETLLLLSHMDVVTAGDLSFWSVPPFAAEMGKGMSSDYLYGRGVLDMKGQAISYLMAMAALKRAGIVPRRDILFVAEPGEESFTPELGIGWVVEHRPDLLAGVTDVFNEGGVNETVTSDIARFGIEVLQKATVNVTLSGKQEALEDYRRLLKERDGQQSFRLVPEVKAFMQFIGPSRNDIWGRYLVEPERALNAAWFRTEAPWVYHALLRDVIYPGEVVKGKDGAPRLDAAVTLLPGTPPAVWRDRLQQWAGERGLTLKVNFMTAESVPAKAEGRAWQTLLDVLSLDHEEAQVGPYALAASYTSSGYLRAKGYRAFGVSPFNVNINDAGKIHANNERIVLAFFIEGVERMSRIVREYATRP